MAPDGRRPAIRLGKVSQRTAESVKYRVEQLLECKMLNRPMEPDLAQWVAKLHPRMAKRFAVVGLIAMPSESVGPTLKNFITEYIAARSDIKPRSTNRLESAGVKLVECFGPDRPLKDFTVGDADNFRVWLIGQGFAENTVRRLCGRAKQFFKAAMRRKLIPENPFADLVSAVRGNPSRFYFVTQDEATKVLDACPDAEWRLLFALSRYGGLRCPSEHLSLRWGDIDWANNRIRVPSPKTEHIEGKESRMIPMFPELKPYLEEAFELAEPGTEFVINRYRSCNANLRTQLMRIIKRAGLKPWGKPFQNLRSTRETELMETFPAHVVCGWIGNSEAIALKHYLQVTDDHFERAVRGEAEAKAGATEIGAQKEAQHAHAGSRGEQHAVSHTNAKAPGLPGPASSCDIVNTRSVPPRGQQFLGAQQVKRPAFSQVNCNFGSELSEKSILLLLARFWLKGAGFGTV
jgi:integrase